MAVPITQTAVILRMRNVIVVASYLSRVRQAREKNKQTPPSIDVGEAVASWLAHSTPERALRVRALARDIVLCSWERHFGLTVPLFAQVYK